MNASPLGAAPHITALEQLVDNRGGLNALGFNGIVRRKALWYDSTYYSMPSESHTVMI